MQIQKTDNAKPCKYDCELFEQMVYCKSELSLKKLGEIQKKL